MKKMTVVLAILLVLILIVGAIVIIPLFAQGKNSGGAETQTEYNHESPEENTEERNILPEVETEEIDGTITDTGSFTSSTDTGLELQVDWSIFTDAEGYEKVRLNVSLNCYNLYVSERYDGITIRLGDEKKFINSAEIDYTGSATSILIGSTVMKLPEEPV